MATHVPAVELDSLFANGRQPPTVLLVGLVGAIGSSLRNALAADGELRVVDAGDPDDVVMAIANARPDAVLFAQSPAPTPVELRRVVSRHPETAVAVAVMELSRERDRALLAAGARVVIPLTMDAGELRAALRLVALGLVGPPPEARLVRHGDGGPAAALTPREAEVLALLAKRRTAREIARVLDIAIPTVNTHTRHIYEKLGVHSRAELERHVRGADGSGDDPPNGGLSRDRVHLRRRSAVSRDAGRPSRLDMRAAMGVARWGRR